MCWTPMISACLLLLLAWGQPVPEPEFDLLILRNGTRFFGLATQESPQHIQFQYLIRKPGVRTLVYDVPFDREEIASLTKAKEPGRTRAKQMIDGLLAGKTREETAARQLRLERVPWMAGTAPSWRYQGRYFHLHSNAQEDLVRLVCVRLEDVFAAYVNTLGTRQTNVQPTHILLFASLTEYQEWQKKRGVAFLNPAVYDPIRREILAGSDLQRLEHELMALRNKHNAQLNSLTAQRDKLLRHFNGHPPAAQLQQLQDIARQLQTVNQENDQAMVGVQSAFFATLFHEAFHAYLDQWVYPSAQYAVPRWLNEGLAQLFENAFVEIGELRVGRIHEQRLQSLQEDIRRGRMISLRELLQAPPQQFFVQHSLDAFESDRHYQAAWALAHYLTFHLKLLNTQKMTDYVSRTARENETASFEKLTGMTLDDCERVWRDYLLRLRPDGTLRP